MVSLRIRKLNIHISYRPSGTLSLPSTAGVAWYEFNMRALPFHNVNVLPAPALAVRPNHRQRRVSWPALNACRQRRNRQQVRRRNRDGGQIETASIRATHYVFAGIFGIAANNAD